MGTRSWRQFWSWINLSFLAIVLGACWVDPNLSEPDEEEVNEFIAYNWYTTVDPAVVDLIQSEEQLRAVEEILLEWEEEDNPQLHAAEKTELASCSGYWGTYRFAGKAEYQTSGYSYYWSPNCFMTAGDLDHDGKGDCGEDYDDNMVSFWMGSDYYSTEAPYRTDGTTSSTDLDLWWHGGGSFRQYTSNAYGPWYGNAYVCLSNWLDPGTLRFGRDY